MTIDPNAVEKAFMDCLFRDEEITPGQVPEGAVLVDGIVGRFGFHPGRLASHTEEVTNWLLALNHTFRKSKGGGWSFLNACEDEDGNQWTGLHQRMEQLFALGLGLDLVTLLIPRELWSALPGGMPYFAVKVG